MADEHAEIALPDVECGWGDGGPTSTAAVAVGLCEHGERPDHSVDCVFPAVSVHFADADRGSRTRSTVASFLKGIRQSITGEANGCTVTTRGHNGDEAADDGDSEDEEAPPILAALEMVPVGEDDGDMKLRPQRPSPPSPKQPALAPLNRDVAAFRFRVDRSSPPPPAYNPPVVDGSGRPRGRIHSLPGSASTSPTESSRSASPPARSPTDTSPTRYRRSTKTSINRGAFALALDGALSESSKRSFDPSAQSSVQAESAMEVGVGMVFHSLASLSPASEADGFMTTVRSTAHVTLPPIVGRSCGSDPLSPQSPALHLRRNSPSRKGYPSATSSHASAQSPSSPNAQASRGGTAIGSVFDVNVGLLREGDETDRLPRCAACGKHLYPSNVLLALDPAHVMHRTCFRCAICHDQLTLANFHEVASTPTDARIQEPSLRRFVCTTHYVERLNARHHHADLP